MKERILVTFCAAMLSLVTMGQPIKTSGNLPIKVGTVGTAIKVSTPPFVVNNLPDTLRNDAGTIVMDISHSVDVVSYSWSVLSGSGNFSNPTVKNATATGCGFGWNTFKCVVSSSSGGVGDMSFSVFLRPTYDSIEAFGANSFYSDDKFFGNINIQPYSSDSSLITYTGVDNPFDASYLGKEFVAFRAHKTEVFPLTRNYSPGRSTCVYAKVIRVIDGKNVRVDFKYNGNNEASPQTTINGYGQFFFDNRSALDSAFKNRKRPIGLSVGKTYVTKGLFGGLYYASEVPVIFQATDTFNTQAANIKFSFEDAFYAATNNLNSGWEQTSAHWAYDHGSRSEGIRMVQVNGDNHFDIRFANIRWLPSAYVNTNNDGSTYSVYFFANGTAGNLTASYQHYGAVDLSGCDINYEKRKWAAAGYTLPGDPLFLHTFNLMYSNSGGRLDSVETITGRRLDVVDMMYYKLRPNHANTVNSSWLTNGTMANLKGKVKTANSTYHPFVASGGYGAAGNYWYVMGLGRNSSENFMTDTLLADIGTQAKDRTYKMPLKATFSKVFINGVPRLTVSGTTDSLWTVWTTESYYNWDLTDSFVATNSIAFDYAAQRVSMPVTTKGVEWGRAGYYGYPDQTNNVTVGLRQVAMAHSVPEVDSVTKVFFYPSRTSTDRFAIYPFIALPGDTLRLSNGDKYKVTSSKYKWIDPNGNVTKNQIIELVGIGGAPAISATQDTVLSFTFETAKMSSILGVAYAGSTGEDLRYNGSEMNYGDQEVNHDFNYVRKYGRLRYGTEFGDVPAHWQQLWKMPKTFRMVQVYEANEFDNFQQMANRSFARREVITGVRSVYLLDGGVWYGVNGGAVSRVRWQNKPQIGGAGFLLGKANTPSYYSRGVEQDGQGADLHEDVRITVQRGDTADLRNVVMDFGLKVKAYDSTSIFLLDNYQCTWVPGTFFGTELSLISASELLGTPDTALLGGRLGPLYPSTTTFVGTFIGAGAATNFYSPNLTLDADNTRINLTSSTLKGNKWYFTNAPTYPQYCEKIKINGLSPTPGSYPITYINPCPPE